MRERIYFVLSIISDDPTDLRPANLAPWGNVKFKGEAEVGCTIKVAYRYGEILYSILYYRVIRIDKTKKSNEIILQYINQKDFAYHTKTENRFRYPIRFF